MVLKTEKEKTKSKASHKLPLSGQLSLKRFMKMQKKMKRYVEAERPVLTRACQIFHFIYSTCCRRVRVLLAFFGTVPLHFLAFCVLWFVQ